VLTIWWFMSRKQNLWNCTEYPTKWNSLLADKPLLFNIKEDRGGDQTEEP